MAIHPTTRGRQVMTSLGGPEKLQPQPEVPINETCYIAVHWPPAGVTDLEWMLAQHRALKRGAKCVSPEDYDAARRIADMLMKDVE